MASVKTGLLAAVWLAMAAAAAAGVDLSGEYWFGSLSADVSSHVPWGKRGNVAISGTIWVQEWDDPAGHHSFYSSFTTDVQADGSINNPRKKTRKVS